eukprot:1921572-Amphidinium_carterae.1
MLPAIYRSRAKALWQRSGCMRSKACNWCILPYPDHRCSLIAKHTPSIATCTRVQHNADRSPSGSGMPLARIRNAAEISSPLLPVFLAVAVQEHDQDS